MKANQKTQELEKRKYESEPENARTGEKEMKQTWKRT